jgi:hypothetical protein
LLEIGSLSGHVINKQYSTHVSADPLCSSDGRSRIVRGIRLLRRHSQTKSVFPRASSARRCAIPDAHAR